MNNVLNNNNIKCVLIDIDGTLINDKKEISDYTKTVIRNLVDKGIKVILTSGRHIDDVVNISKNCNASNIVIANNGAVIYDYCQNNFLNMEKLSYEYIEKIFDLCSKYNTDIIYNSLNLRYRTYNFLDKKYNEKNDIIIENLQDVKQDVYQTVLLSFDSNKFIECIKQVEKYGLRISNRGQGSNGIMFADINLKQTSKGNAIKKLIKFLNIKEDNIICFGDSINDIEMFNECGIRVAMKNAISELKENADYITEYSNNEDGVVKFLDYYFNIQ